MKKLFGDSVHYINKYEHIIVFKNNLEEFRVSDELLMKDKIRLNVELPFLTS